jgi:chemotaxis signal transduction protein
MSHDGRLLTFEVEGRRYALAIAGVLEVVEAGKIAGIPTLPRSAGGVMNWHGDALPVVSPGLVFEEVTQVGCGSEYVLVLSEPGGETARLGMPIDRVVGLVDGPAPSGRVSQWVLERRPIDGRVVNVLDPRGLLARAESVIAEAAH